MCIQFGDLLAFNTISTSLTFQWLIFIPAVIWLVFKECDYRAKKKERKKGGKNAFISICLKDAVLFKNGTTILRPAVRSIHSNITGQKKNDN